MDHLHVVLIRSNKEWSESLVHGANECANNISRFRNARPGGVASLKSSSESAARRIADGISLQPEVRVSQSLLVAVHAIVTWRAANLGTVPMLITKRLGLEKGTQTNINKDIAIDCRNIAVAVPSAYRQSELPTIFGRKIHNCVPSA